MAATRRMKYNPAFLKEEELIASFSVKRHEFHEVLELIEENDGPTNQHVLLVGPRGIGKTTLALRIVAEVRRDEELRQRWQPVIFPEESYEVASPGEFWLAALEHAATAIESETMIAAHGDLRNEQDDQRLAARALGELLDYSDRIGKRLLLVVENLNMMLGEQLNEQQAWHIRKILLAEPRLMLLATATHADEEFRNERKAMFEVFSHFYLEPFTTAQCRQLWESATGQPISERKVRPLQILTGGNARLLTIVAGFARDMSFNTLMDNLVLLVDEHTEYFKSHLESLPPLERKVYLALLKQWEPCTARTVAGTARLDVNRTSSLLKRLQDRGKVSIVETGGKKHYYQASERLYNIYYLMRRRGTASGRVRAVVDFMTAMYEKEEWPELIKQLGQEMAEHCAGDSASHKEAINLLWSKLPDELKDERAAWLTGLPEQARRALDAEFVGEQLDQYSGMLVREDTPAGWNRQPEFGDVENSRNYIFAKAMFIVFQASQSGSEDEVKEYADKLMALVTGMGAYGVGLIAAYYITKFDEPGLYHLIEKLADPGLYPDDRYRASVIGAEPMVRGFLGETEAALEVLADDLRRDKKRTLSESRIDAFSILAARGAGEALLKILRRFRNKGELEPMIVALEQELGREVLAPAEVLEVARDLRAEIDNWRQRITAYDQWKAASAAS